MQKHAAPIGTEWCQKINFFHFLICITQGIKKFLELFVSSSRATWVSLKFELHPQRKMPYSNLKCRKSDTDTDTRKKTTPIIA